MFFLTYIFAFVFILERQGFPCGSAGKESACNAGDLGLIPGLGRSPGEGKGYPLQYSGLEKSMDCIVHGVTKSWTTEQLSLLLERQQKSLIKGDFCCFCKSCMFCPRYSCNT